MYRLNNICHRVMVTVLKLPFEDMIWFCGATQASVPQFLRILGLVELQGNSGTWSIFPPVSRRVSWEFVSIFVLCLFQTSPQLDPSKWGLPQDGNWGVLLQLLWPCTTPPLPPISCLGQWYPTVPSWQGVPEPGKDHPPHLLCFSPFKRSSTHVPLLLLGHPGCLGPDLVPGGWPGNPISSWVIGDWGPRMGQGKQMLSNSHVNGTQEGFRVLFLSSGW